MQLTGSVLASGRWSRGSQTGAGLVRGAGGVGGAELHSCGVLQRVLTRLHLKRHGPHPHQPPLLASFSLMGHVGSGPPADHAAGCEEDRGYHQEKGPDDNGSVASRDKGAKGESSHQGDVDASQHDAQATGAAQGRGGQALVQQGERLGGFLWSRGS